MLEIFIIIIIYGHGTQGCMLIMHDFRRLPIYKYVYKYRLSDGNRHYASGTKQIGEAYVQQCIAIG